MTYIDHVQPTETSGLVLVTGFQLSQWHTNQIAVDPNSLLANE